METINRIRPDKRYNCPNCQFSFKRTEHLNRHILTHSKQKPYPCNSCPQKFARFDALKRHSHKMHNLNMSIKDYRQISNSSIWNAYQSIRYNSSSTTLFSSVSKSCSGSMKDYSFDSSISSLSTSSSCASDETKSLQTDSPLSTLANVCFMEKKKDTQGRIPIDFLLN